MTRAAAELEASLPQDVGTVVCEALRVEVQPVAQRMSQVGLLLEQLTSAVEGYGPRRARSGRSGSTT